ncbi:MAG TPA: hypothetical protein VFL42_07960 [Terriglobales bacterium]|nr:hypothetical protein [Terriglobales bacterium]
MRELVALDFESRAALDGKSATARYGADDTRYGVYRERVLVGMSAEVQRATDNPSIGAFINGQSSRVAGSVGLKHPLPCFTLEAEPL